VKPQHQHEPNPVLITPAMMQKMGKHMQIAGEPAPKKPWWKLW
jgi:hypothetical protein